MALAYAVRDRMLQRWISTAAAYTAQGSRTVAYLSAEFLMGPHLGNNLINLGIYDAAREAVARARPGSRGAACDRKRSRASATAASAGWRPASSIRWRRWRCRASATASATSSASSSRRSSTAGRWRRPTSGCASAIRGSWCARSGRCDVKFGGHTERYIDEQGRHARALGAGARWSTACPTTRRSWATTTTPPTRCGCGAPRRPSRSTSRCSTAATTTAPCNQKVAIGEHHQGALSERRAGARQGAAARAAVLLRLLLAAGHAAHHAASSRFRPSASTRSSRSSSTTRIPRSRSPS